MSKNLSSQRPTNFRWIIFALSCGTSWFLYLHRYMFGLIKPKLMEEYDLSNTQLGLLDSTFSLCYSVFQVPMGIGVDAFGVHLMLTGMILLWCLGLAFHVLPPMGGLSIARATLGTGQAGVFAALSRVTKQWFPPIVRTTVQGWVGVFFGRAGGVCANLIIGSLVLGVLNVPWRTAVYVLTGIGIVHAILFYLLYRNSPTKHGAVNEEEAKLIADGEPAEISEGERRMTFREMFRRMSPASIFNLLSLNVQSILSNVADNIYSAWIPQFLILVHGLKYKEMGIYASLPLIGGALGGMAGGYLNDITIRRLGNRRWGRTAVGFAGKGLASVMLLVALYWYDDPYKFCMMLFFVKFFSDWSLTTSWGVVTDIGGPATASVFAFNNAVGTIGAILAPAMYGAIADVEWKYVFMTGAGAYFLCACSWLLIDCRIPVIAEDAPPDKDK